MVNAHSELARRMNCMEKCATLHYMGESIASPHREAHHIKESARGFSRRNRAAAHMFRHVQIMPMYSDDAHMFRSCPSRVTQQGRSEGGQIVRERRRLLNDA